MNKSITARKTADKERVNIILNLLLGFNEIVTNTCGGISINVAHYFKHRLIHKKEHTS